MKQKLKQIIMVLKKTITFDFYIKKPLRTHVFYLLLIFNMLVYHFLYDQYKSNIQKEENTISIRPVLASTEEKKDLTVEEYILQEAREAGLDPKEVSCIIRNESGWNQYAINKNNNGTYDLGIWQINDIHKLPRETAFDYKKATEWAINKRLHDGNWNAWYGYLKCK